MQAVMLALVLFAVAQWGLAAAMPDVFAFQSDGAAKAAWRPMDGSLPVARADVQGRKAVRMPCKFRGTRIERASWDFQGRMDLTGCSAIRFRILCSKPEPISNFTIYFGSGDGWYRGGFAPEAVGEWSEVVVAKEQMEIEGKPAGWGNVDRIRISAWRGEDEDTEFYVADFAPQQVSSGVMVVRGDSLAQLAPDQLGSAVRFTQSSSALLREAGVECAVVGDLDLTPETLAEAKLVVLPHNPAMPEASQQAIVRFMERGGKVMAFYQMPAGLASAAGLQPLRYMREARPGNFASIRAEGDGLAEMPKVVQQHSWNVMKTQAVAGRGQVAAYWFDGEGKSTGVPAVIVTDRAAYMSHVATAEDAAAKRQMVMAMAGQMVPELWRDVASRAYEEAGRIGKYANFDEAAAALGNAGAGAKQQMERAAGLRAEAQQLLRAGRYPAALRHAQDARRAVIDAYCLAREPVSGEHRALWCHSAFGVAGMSWDQAIRKLADNGFTAIFPNMLWGGSAFYDSTVLPVAPEVATRGDQIKECLAACRKYGVELHVWKVNWNMGWSAPEEFARRMKADARTQVSFDGKANDRWLCPSHPLNQELEIAAMVEVATKYEVDGIHFDYIRYPGPEGCFCRGCRERFEQRIGRAVKNWPADVRNDVELASQWQQFRRDNITRVVSKVSRQVREAGRKTKISAAVFPNYTVDRDSVGQDWKLWCERGYLDFVCPMDYTPRSAEFRNLVSRQNQWAGKVPVYPGIGVSTWPGSERDVVKLIDQIGIARELGCKGFMIFEYNTAEVQSIVEACGKGVTRK